MFTQGDGVRLKVDLWQYPFRRDGVSGDPLYSEGDRLTVVRRIEPRPGITRAWDYWCSGSNGEVGVAAHEIEEVSL